MNPLKQKTSSDYSQRDPREEEGRGDAAGDGKRGKDTRRCRSGGRRCQSDKEGSGLGKAPGRRWVRKQEPQPYSCREPGPANHLHSLGEGSIRAQPADTLISAL